MRIFSTILSIVVLGMCVTPTGLHADQALLNEDRTLRWEVEQPRSKSKQSSPKAAIAAQLGRSIVERIRTKNTPDTTRYGFDIVHLDRSELWGTDFETVRVRGGISKLDTNAQTGVQLIVGW